MTKRPVACLAECFHNAWFGYGLTKAEANVLAHGYYDQGMELIKLTGELAAARRDADAQRALVELLTKQLETPPP